MWDRPWHGGYTPALLWPPHGQGVRLCRCRLVDPRPSSTVNVNLLLARTRGHWGPRGRGATGLRGLLLRPRPQHSPVAPRGTGAGAPAATGGPLCRIDSSSGQVNQEDRWCPAGALACRTTRAPGTHCAAGGSLASVATLDAARPVRFSVGPTTDMFPGERRGAEGGRRGRRTSKSLSEESRRVRGAVGGGGWGAGEDVGVAGWPSVSRLVLSSPALSHPRST